MPALAGGQPAAARCTGGAVYAGGAGSLGHSFLYWLRLFVAELSFLLIRHTAPRRRTGGSFASSTCWRPTNTRSSCSLSCHPQPP